MDFLWPGILPLLGLIPLMGALYLWSLRRRRRFAVRYSSLALVREAMGHQSSWRRHLPFALFSLALASLVFTLGRPVAVVPIPTEQSTIILALDTSGSMSAVDIPPSRLAAAESAARFFIQHQKAHTQIGLVAFAHSAEVIQQPTSDQEALQNSVESIVTGRDGTAIGSGILKALDAIAAVDKSVAPTVTDPNSQLAPTPVAKGAYAPGIIVLLTDGENTAGPSPLETAKQAADRGIRIYTIGYGTDKGLTPGKGIHTEIDENPLKQIANMTGGEYYIAASAGDLRNVLSRLPTHLITKHETWEVSVIFAALGAVLAALAVGTALRWHPLP